ncbi:hypothetical protein BDV06DRAFT_153148 [Aspergillus oleicola]
MQYAPMGRSGSLSSTDHAIPFQLHDRPGSSLRVCSNFPSGSNSNPTSRRCWPKCNCKTTPYSVVIDDIPKPHTGNAHEDHPSPATTVSLSRCVNSTGTLGKPNIRRGMFSSPDSSLRISFPDFTLFVDLPAGLVPCCGSGSWMHGHLPDFGIRSTAVHDGSCSWGSQHMIPSASSFSGYWLA